MARRIDAIVSEARSLLRERATIDHALLGTLGDRGDLIVGADPDTVSRCASINQRLTSLRAAAYRAGGIAAVLSFPS